MSKTDTKKWKRDFVHKFMRSMTTSFLAHINAGDVPAEWDRHELRAWIAREFDFECAHTAVMQNKRGKRYRDFLSACYAMPRR